MKEKNTVKLWKTLIGKMKDDKKFEAAVYIIILAFMVLLYLLIGRTPGAGKERTEEISEGGMEKRLELTLERMRGVGDAHVMISYSEGGTQIDGVIVIADGADDIMTRGSIQSAVHTLLGIDAEKVGVYKMNKITEGN